MLTLQLYFDRLETLEAAAAKDGGPQALAADRVASLAAGVVGHQAMWTRPYPTPSTLTETNGPLCSCLVHYPGAAEDLDAWLLYYLAHRPQVMYDFPGVREIEFFTRIDWIDTLPWPRLDFMQRNKLVFDSVVALEAALHSPVREAMKADREHFPPFEGGNVRYPMISESLVGPALVPLAR